MPGTMDLTASAFSSSPEFTFFYPQPVGTPRLRQVKSLGLFSIPRDTQVGDWRLKSVLLAQLKTTRKQWVAMTHLAGIAEYGTGKSEVEAITDLIVSLGECRYVLERRAETRRLGASTREGLECLQNLIERAS